MGGPSPWGSFWTITPPSPPGVPSQSCVALCALRNTDVGRGWLRVRVGNPACYFCAVWVPGAVGEWGWRWFDVGQLTDVRGCTVEHPILGRGQGRVPQVRRGTLAMLRSPRSRELCQPRMEADGKPVTEGNLSLRAPRASSRLDGCAVRPGQVGNRAYPADLHGRNPHAANWLHQYAHRQGPGRPLADVAGPMARRLMVRARTGYG